MFIASVQKMLKMYTTRYLVKQKKTIKQNTCKREMSKYLKMNWLDLKIMPHSCV